MVLSHFKARGYYRKPIVLFVVFILLSSVSLSVYAEASVPQTDQTPLTPLTAPSPASEWPRYISGFGVDNSYTIFYEDRNDSAGCSYGYRIKFNQTTTGAMGFATTSTSTDICDTHFTVKDWPITLSGYGTYSYRGWGSVDNNPYHDFYVSNNLVNWTRIYYGTGMFSDPSNIMSGETINYGFHDIMEINNNYIGFVESAGGNTYIAWSDLGDDVWTIVAKVGGSEAGDLPLSLSFTSAGPIPTGNFLLMYVDDQLVYGKLMTPGNRQGAYLAINAAAAQAATPTLAEAAFIDPANWTWSDGSTGQPDNDSAVLLSTLSSGGHDVRESFLAPTSAPQSDYVILYTANYTSGSASHGIGCASSSAECLVVLPPTPTTLPVTAATTVPTELPIPLTGFAPDRVTRLTSEKPAFDNLEMRLIIPAIGVDEEIVGVPQKDGAWDVSWLGEQVGYLNGTAFPTWTGNSVLTGHVYGADGLPGVFARLNALKWGDRVIVLMGDQQYNYEIRQVKTVTSDDTSSVFAHEDQAWLTLVTCLGYDESSDSYRYRIVVKAVLIDFGPGE
jgi:LPXTG-site transpeptidase (sortase) family protein